MAARPAPRSLQSRLTALLVAGIGLPLVAGGVALAVLVPSWLRSHHDDALLTRARALVSMTTATDGVVELEFSDQFMPEFQSEDDPYYFEVWVDGALLERSRSFTPARGVQLAALTLEAGLADEPRLSSGTLPDGRAGRLARIDFVPEAETAEEEAEEDVPGEEEFEEDEDVVSPVLAAASGTGRIASVLVAGTTEELDARVAQVRIGAGLLTLLLVGLLVGFVRLSLALGLRPIRGAVRQVAGIDVETLGRRVDAQEAPAELLPLLEAFNRLLDRVEGAFGRERRLTADMAHELKTPIAELRNLSEVGQRVPEDREAAARFFADAASIARQMERVVTHLLELARQDAGRQVVQREALDLDVLLARAWRPLQADAEARGIDLVVHVPTGLSLSTDAAKLDLVVSNLLSNAVSYSREGSTISCTAALQAGRVRLDIRNQADGLEQADIPLMFDRFWRKDEARTGASSAGLGLSLVRSFAALLAIDLRASLAPEGVLEMRLEFPPADLVQPADRAAAASSSLAAVNPASGA